MSHNVIVIMDYDRPYWAGTCEEEAIKQCGPFQYFEIWSGNRIECGWGQAELAKALNSLKKNDTPTI